MPSLSEKPNVSRIRNGNHIMLIVLSFLSFAVSVSLVFVAVACFGSLNDLDRSI